VVSAPLPGLDWAGLTKEEAAVGDVVNLNRVRKERNKRTDAQRTAENRVRHGLKKDRKATDNAAKQRLEAELDGKKLT
jgi:hypothetical protein